MLFSLRPPALEPEERNAESRPLGAGWGTASPFRPWRFSLVLEVGPVGTAIGHGYILSHVTNALLPYSHARRPENPQGHKHSTGWT